MVLIIKYENKQTCFIYIYTHTHARLVLQTQLWLFFLPFKHEDTEHFSKQFTTSGVRRVSRYIQSSNVNHGIKILGHKNSASVWQQLLSIIYSSTSRTVYFTIHVKLMTSVLNHARLKMTAPQREKIKWKSFLTLIFFKPSSHKHQIPEQDFCPFWL